MLMDFVFIVGADLLGLKPVSASSLAAAAAARSADINSNSPSKLSSTTPNPTVMEEAARKRELRLLKNREAAKECRRKKKEYVKCLENRVAVLETQNKQLIEELKTLKELYCRKAD
ncbi:unnamed protein product [Soboliphyme baturini]|uniref:BZIP domain-containing protein n=1 Tax=Soboliphyme baturini TaxID=241478 RepID=A0A183IMP8_9BILA|nr:unnamed protein product [Soboliphyme baturini]